MQAVRVNGNVNQSECIALLASSYNARPCKPQNNNYNQLFEAAREHSLLKSKQKIYAQLTQSPSRSPWLLCLKICFWANNLPQIRTTLDNSAYCYTDTQNVRRTAGLICSAGIAFQAIKTIQNSVICCFTPKTSMQCGSYCFKALS